MTVTTTVIQEQYISTNKEDGSDETKKGTIGFCYNLLLHPISLYKEEDTQTHPAIKIPRPTHRSWNGRNTIGKLQPPR